MERILKIWVMLLQILFYIFAALTVIAFIFWSFGAQSFSRVFNIFLVTLALLFSYMVFYRLYTIVFKKDDYKTIPEHLDALNQKSAGDK